jgi:hypothetical protein
MLLRYKNKKRQAVKPGVLVYYFTVQAWTLAPALGLLIN